MKILKEDDNEEGTDFEADVYTEKGREELVEEDEIDASEAGFMEGFENTDLAYCDNCKKNFTDEDNIIEEVINDKKLRFCCQECKEQYHKKNG